MVKKLNQFYIFLFLFCYRVLRGKEVRRNGDEAVFRLCEDFQIASAVHRVCRESRTRKFIPSLNALPLPFVYVKYVHVQLRQTYFYNNNIT